MPNELKKDHRNDKKLQGDTLKLIFSQYTASRSSSMQV